MEASHLERVAQSEQFFEFYASGFDVFVRFSIGVRVSLRLQRLSRLQRSLIGIQKLGR
jgi:hypothetical protein